MHFLINEILGGGGDRVGMKYFRNYLFLNADE